MPEAQPIEAPSLFKRLSNLNRLRQVLQTFARHGFTGFVDQLGLADKSLAEPPDKGEKVAARFGRRLALALSDLGPTFVKLGQLLATREDILPQAVVRELKELQDNARPFPVEQARERIEAELKAPVEKLFAAFDDEPLAAASIGQVHRARTRDGLEVVVKVRRPGIEEAIAEDLDLLHSLAELIERRIPESQRYDPVGLVREFSQSLRGELDFRREAESLRRMRRALGRTGRVPKVVVPLSAHGVMTLEFLKGKKLAEVRDRAAREGLAQSLLASFARQYLRAGFFHADPHPGNLLVLEGGRLAFLDLGAAGTVDAGMRRMLLRLAASAVRRDGEGMADALLSMAERSGPIDKAAYLAEVGPFLEGLVGKPLSKVKIPELTGEIFDVTRRYGLRLKPQYFLLMRSSAILDGVLRELSPRIDVVAAARSHVLRAMIAGGWLGSALTIAARMLLIGIGLGPHAPRWRRLVAGTLASLLLAAGMGYGGWFLLYRSRLWPEVIEATVGAPEAVVYHHCDLRHAAERKAPSVGKIRKGTRVRILGKARVFSEVVFASGARGFVLNEDIDFDPPKAKK